jgi:hypothetical protein
VWCQTTLHTILIGSSAAQMTHNFLFSYYDYSSFSLHYSVHSSASIVDRQLLQVPMALASILIEHCLCSLHPFCQPVSSASVGLFHVFGVGRIVCLSSGISLGIYPYWANLGRHEIFQFMAQLYTEQFTEMLKLSHEMSRVAGCSSNSLVHGRVSSARNCGCS